MNVITTTRALQDFCDASSSYDFVTVDTEFLRESTYWPKLCLIQAAHTDDAVIIDPLAAGLDLTPFYELLANEGVVKVFHAARQDIEIFVRSTGKVPHPCFDTQIAASVCGYGDSASYDSLVRAICDGQVDKSSRFTDWSVRPLSEKQLTYALADVTYLRDIYLHLKSKLGDKGRAEWVADDNEILSSVETYVVDPKAVWRRIKARIHKPRDLAALMKLAEWRELKAQANDQPRGRILKDDAIAELAIQRPKDAAGFEKLRAVPRGFGRSPSASEILSIIEKVEAQPKDSLPELPARALGPSPKGPIGDLLRVLLKSVAEQNGVASRIIATSDDIDAIVISDDADVPALTGWRRRIFGEKALAIKHGKLALAANRKGVIEIDVTQS